MNKQPKMWRQFIQKNYWNSDVTGWSNIKIVCLAICKSHKTVFFFRCYYSAFSYTIPIPSGIQFHYPSPRIKSCTICLLSVGCERTPKSVFVANAIIILVWLQIAYALKIFIRFKCIHLPSVIINYLHTKPLSKHTN